MSPLYGWSGPGEMREMSQSRATTPDLEEPSMVTSTHDQHRFFKCNAPECGRKFRKAMIFARHFNSSHEDLRDNKESWRKYAEEVWE